MKTITRIFVVFSLVVGPTLAIADTSTSTQIQALLTQIQTLQAQIEALHSAQQQVQTTVQNISGTLSLIRSLRQGMSGDDVKALQAILAADPTVYPQGLITGFFGQMTSEAVKKFQKKHGIEALGFVGPQTLRKLNEEKDNLGLDIEATSTERDEDHGEHKRLCAKIPPGHLIAPGWLKHEGNEMPIVPPCQTLPPGILNKHPMFGTTTPPTSDTTAPIISNISASTTVTTSTIKWNTDENSTSSVWFSSTTPINFSTATMTSIVGGVTNHSVLLSGLSTSTTYYFVVGSTDFSGNTATSSQNSFVTQSQ